MLWTAIFGTVAALVGSVLHELTHAAAARAVGAEIREISLRGLWVEYVLPYTAPRWKNRVVGLAPLLVGVGVGALYYGTLGQPTTREGIVVAIGWAVYTFWGSVEDLSPEIAEDAADSRLEVEASD